MTFLLCAAPRGDFCKKSDRGGMLCYKIEKSIFWGMRCVLRTRIDNCTSNCLFFSVSRILSIYFTWVSFPSTLRGTKEQCKNRIDKIREKKE